MDKAKRKAFNALKLPTQYPQSDVAEHEVLMAFLNDEDAAFFREWWADRGSYDFNEWLDKRETAEQRHQQPTPPASGGSER